jgi:tRNA dimethylallyltransferase
MAITGPTTSGKTELSLAVARELRGEIISMDSRQVYRGMDIGTDKVTAGDRTGVPHFGLDLVDPDERYSAGQFARDARGWVEEIRGRDHLPILAGGTGFFLNAVLRPLFDEPPMDPSRREALRSYLGRLSRDRLAAWVRALDPDRAGMAVEGGPQRMSRTAEVPLLTGRPLSWWHHAARASAPGVPCLVVILELDRDRLDERIDARVDAMVERGLVEEVERLLERGFGPGDPGMTGTGYREVAASLRGEMSLEEALDRMRLQTRQYARRQITWFRHQSPPGALRLAADLPLDERVQQVVAAWSASQKGSSHTS